jgi:trigger factor
LKDKTLAGKKAVFDVDILTASYRSVPEVTDEFAAQVRPEMTAESLNEELRKAIDEEDAKEFIDERNKALGTALATRLEVEVPDTLVTNQARDKYAMMMSDFREQGMADEEIKKMISPENFLKYKEIEKPDIVRDFKISMATDEIARLESIEVEPSAVDEQIGSLRQEAGDEEFDEAQVRAKVESTLQRRLVFDFLNEHSSLDVEYVEENENFDEEMMQKLADESLQREKENAEKEAAAAAAAASADEE